MDSRTLSARVRAERAAKIAVAGVVINPDYVSLVVDQLPESYQSGSGVATGAYIKTVGQTAGIQIVIWDALAEGWEDIGEPIPRLSDIADIVKTIDEPLIIKAANDSEFQAALRQASGLRSEFQNGGVELVIELAVDILIEAQYYFKDTDMSHVRITSEAGTVKYSRSAITNNFGGGGQSSSALINYIPAVFTGNNAHMPKFDLVMEMVDNDVNNVLVYAAWNNSKIFIAPGGGAVSGVHTLMVYSSNAHFESTVWDNNSGNGPRGESSSDMSGQNISARNCAVGFFLRNGGDGDIRNADLSGASDKGCWVRGSFLNARGVNAQKGASPSNEDFVVERGGIIAAYEATGGGNIIPNQFTDAGAIIRDWPNSRGGGIISEFEDDKYYVKYPDGTMLVIVKNVTLDATLAVGEGFRSSGQERVTVEFPQDFNLSSSFGTPSVKVNTVSSSRAWGTSVATPEAGQVEVGLLSFESVTDVECEVIAWGRWDQSQVIGENPPE